MQEFPHFCRKGVLIWGFFVCLFLLIFSIYPTSHPTKKKQKKTKPRYKIYQKGKGDGVPM